jgi:hypothetical protein
LKNIGLKEGGKRKKEVGLKRGGFEEETYEWLKWKLVQKEDFSFHKPRLNDNPPSLSTLPPVERERVRGKPKSFVALYIL